MNVKAWGKTTKPSESGKSTTEVIKHRKRVFNFAIIHVFLYLAIESGLTHNLATDQSSLPALGYAGIEGY